MAPYCHDRSYASQAGLISHFMIFKTRSKSEPVVSPASTGQNTSVAAFASGYTNLYKVTPRFVQMNPELARLCVGASKEQGDAARIRFGPHANAAVFLHEQSGCRCLQP